MQEASFNRDTAIGVKSLRVSTEVEEGVNHPVMHDLGVLPGELPHCFCYEKSKNAACKHPWCQPITFHQSAMKFLEFCSIERVSHGLPPFGLSSVEVS